MIVLALVLVVFSVCGDVSLSVTTGKYCFSLIIINRYRDRIELKAFVHGILLHLWGLRFDKNIIFQ